MYDLDADLEKADKKKKEDLEIVEVNPYQIYLNRMTWNKVICANQEEDDCKLEQVKKKTIKQNQEPLSDLLNEKDLKMVNKKSLLDYWITFLFGGFFEKSNETIKKSSVQDTNSATAKQVETPALNLVFAFMPRNPHKKAEMSLNLSDSIEVTDDIFTK